MKVTVLQNHMWEGEVNISTLDQLAELSLKRDWSHAVFKDKTRKTETFLYSNYFVVDIDDGMPLQEAEKIASRYSCFIVLSRNHQKEKNGLICDRYRIVFELEWPITSKEQFKATFAFFKELFPTLDEAASSNCAGQWFKGSALHSLYKGVLVKPALEDRQAVVTPTVEQRANMPSKNTMKFIVHVNELVGKRWEPFRKAVIDLKQQGFSMDQAKALLTSVHSEWFTDEYDQKLYGIYNNVSPRYPARADSFEEAELERWTREWLVSNEVSCTFSGALSIKGIYYSFEDVCRKMRIDRDRSGSKIYEEKIKDYLAEWISIARQAHLETVVASIRPYKGALAERELESFVTAAIVNPSALEIAVVKHFVWQVKRKMLKLPVTYHMMPVFYGPQGSGKSTAILKLLSPLGELVSTPTGFNFVKDYREIQIFKDNFAIFSDEMAQADKADVNVLKNLISSPFVENRVMKLSTRERYANNATMIGATNRPLKDVIMDDTGARRFYELTCPSRMDYSAINAIDYALIWNAIDAEAESPIVPLWNEIAAVQEERFRSKGPVELWMEEKGLEVDNEGEGIDTEIALKQFVDYEGGHWTNSSFGKTLSRLGVKKKRIRRGNDRVYVYGLRKPNQDGGEEF